MAVLEISRFCWIFLSLSALICTARNETGFGVHNAAPPLPRLGVDMVEGAAKTLGLYIHSIAFKELAVQDMNKVLKQATFTMKTVDDETIATDLALSISNKLDKYKHALHKAKSALDVLHFFNTVPPTLSREQCCDFSPMRLMPDTKFQVAINKNTFCDISAPPDYIGSKSIFSSSPPEPSSSSSGLASNLSSVFSMNLAGHPGIRWQYFISSLGRESVYPAWGQPGRPCVPQSIQHGQVVLNTLVRKPLHLVFIIDCAVTDQNLQVAKSAVSYMISQLRDEDRIAITSKDLNINQNCPPLWKLGHSIESVKSSLIATVSSLHPCGRHRKDGLDADVTAARKILAASASEVDSDPHILLFTDRNKDKLVNSFSDENRYNENWKLSLFVSQPESNPLPTEIPPLNLGFTTHISNTSFPETFAKFCLYLSSQSFKQSIRQKNHGPILQKPYVDRVGNGLLIPISQTVIANDNIVGVVGLDIQAAELLEELAYAQHTPDTHTFVMLRCGLVLSHPNLPTPEQWSSMQLLHVQDLEADEQMHDLLRNIVTMPSGNYLSRTKSYSWKEIKDSDLIVIVVSPKKTRIISTLESVAPISTGSRIQFHSLIPEGKSKLCRHMRDIASMETSALYLAPATYALPYENLIGIEVPLKIQSYMAYLTDPTRLIANPGLKRGVRESVTLLAHVVDSWKDLAFSSSLNNYIIRRRIVSSDGVQLSYPGTAEQEGSDPTKERWYQLAIKSPDQVIISPPKLDAGGVGFIITVSSAISQNQNSTNKENGNENSVVAVVSADFTLEYFYKILNDTIPDNFCSRPNSRCFMFDDTGNIVSHPQLSRDSMKFARFPTKVHLTHMESTIATDVLVDRNFIRKKVCKSLQTQKLFRYFEVIGNSSDVYRNKNRPDCMNYRITGIPGTNLWLGLVEQDCQSTSFCWCSTVDTTCFECTSLDEERCECPCECSSQAGSTCPLVQLHNKLSKTSETGIQVCLHEPKPYQRQGYASTRFEHFPPCIHTDCSSRKNIDQCYGVLGCSWCDTEMDGDTPIHTPACVPMAECFGGVLNSVSPYSRIFDQSMVLTDSNEDRSLSRAGPIGPVAGSIMAFFLFLALAVWGYKHWSAGNARGLIPGVNNGSSLRINQIEDEIEDTAQANGHQNYGLDSNQAISVVSPYRMNPTYRRPRPAGTDSDHGYSTMTPCGDQDSEVMSCLGEVGSAAHRRQRNRGPASLHSVTSGNSSGTSSPLNAGHHELSNLSSKDTLSQQESERENLITVHKEPGVPSRNHHINGTVHHTAGNNGINGKGQLNRGGGGVPPELVDGMTVLNKNQFLVSATVHMVET